MESGSFGITLESGAGFKESAQASLVVLGTGTLPKPAGYNADDVAFATNMIPHHQQAIDLAALVPDRSTNPELAKLASAIADAQGPEIETMKVFLVQWNENPDTDTGSGHGGHGSARAFGDPDRGPGRLSHPEGRQPGTRVDRAAVRAQRARCPRFDAGHG
jgi:hypothetical protein